MIVLQIMMLRRRVERKAKLVATVLFKEMANVRGWNSHSQSISVKRAKQVSSFLLICFRLIELIKKTRHLI